MENLRNGSACAQAAIHDAYAVALAPAWRGALVDGARLAVVQAHNDVVAMRGAHIAFDLVTGHGAANGAQYGGDLLAVAAAHLMTEQAADHGAARRTYAAARGARIDFMDGFDHAAIAANRWRCWWRCCHLRFRLRLRLSLSLSLLLRLQLRWLLGQGGQRLHASRWLVGLQCGHLRAGRAGIERAGIALRRRQPAHQGGRADAAKQQHGNSGCQDEWMGGFCGSHVMLLYVSVGNQ